MSPACGGNEKASATMTIVIVTAIHCRLAAGKYNQAPARASTPPDAVSTGEVKKETQIIAIYGKGGIGKSFTLANLIEAGYSQHDREKDRAFLVECFRTWMKNGGNSEFWSGPTSDERYRKITDRIAELRGKDLACFCPLDKPCHADVLLEIANK